MVDTLIFRSFKLIEFDITCFVSLIQFLCPFTRIPLRFEFREQALDLAEIHAVRALIRSCILGIFNLAAWYGLFNYIGKLSNAIVLIVTPYIECLIMNDLTRRVQRCDESAGNIFDMNNRAPWRTIAFNQYFSCG